MTLPEFAGFVANITSNVAFVPQIIKSYRTKRVDDLSIGMFFILFSTQLCWICYAIPLGARNLWISSATEIILLLPIFVMWWRYRGAKRPLSLMKPSVKQIMPSRVDYGLEVANSD